MKKLLLLFVVVFTSGTLNQAVAGSPAEDPRCHGLSGAAFGMCAAAIAVGCDDPATPKPGCEKIAENFTQITGKEPPWEVSCPCWSTEDLNIASTEYAGFYCREMTVPDGIFVCADELCDCAQFCCIGTAIIEIEKENYKIEFGPLRAWYSTSSSSYGCSVWGIQSRSGEEINRLTLEITAEEYAMCAQSLEPYLNQN